jgi:transcriptional regulator with XRE-family HTH domain
LRAVRDGLGLTQAELIDQFGLDGYVNRSEVSDFERGVREPDLLTLKAYAEGAGVYVDDLIDDSVDLPEVLPAAWRMRGVKGKTPIGQVRAPANTTTVMLWLEIESDTHHEREENEARKGIEKSHLSRYGMKRLSDNEYELVFSHGDEEDLDSKIYALLGAIKNEAKRKNCSVKLAAREKGVDNYW